MDSANPAPGVEALHFEPGRTIPNNPRLPAVLMRAALENTDPGAVRALFAENGWGGAWQYTVFPFHHFHPNAHEVLAVVSGSARIMLGGPEGRVVAVAAGDVMVLPAGTGHCRIEAASGFSVCGAYPSGQEDYETLREGEADAATLSRIAAVPLPERDPIHGADGPVVSLWAEA